MIAVCGWSDLGQRGNLGGLKSRFPADKFFQFPNWAAEDCAIGSTLSLATSLQWSFGFSWTQGCRVPRMRSLRLREGSS